MHRLRTTKHTVDTAPPQKPEFFKTAPRKKQLLLEQFKKIELSNKKLLDKMIKIDLKPSALNPIQIEKE